MMTCKQLFDLFRAKHEELRTKYPRIGPFEAGRLATCGGSAFYDFRETSAQLLMNASGQLLEVHGGIYERWMEEGGGDGALGLPVTDEEDYHGSDAKPGDRVSAFENGLIVWRAATWKTEVRGNFRVTGAKDGVQRVEGRPRKNAKDIGVVLSGGGAKGAFQAGVWRAMCELGLAERVAVLSGTSVGALNAAAFATLGSAEKICRLWLDQVGNMASANLRLLSPKALFDGVANIVDGKAFPLHGLLNRDALEGVVRSILPPEWPADAPPVFSTALECRAKAGEELLASSYRLCRFRLDLEPDVSRRVKQLMASAAIPWGFDPVEIGDRRYVDGGWDAQGGNNVPVEPVLHYRPAIRTLVVIRCNSAEVEPEPLPFQGRSGVQMVEVRPTSTLRGIFGAWPDLVGPMANQLKGWSGTFAFDRKYAERYMRQGYRDGLMQLRELRL